MKKLSPIRVGFIVVAVLVIALLCAQLSKTPSESEKRNVYAILPLTGAASAGGSAIKKAMEVYLKEHTDLPFSLLFVDSETDPTKSIANLTQAIMNEKHPLVIIATTATTGAVMPVVNQAGGYAFPIVTMDTETVRKQHGYQRVSCGLTDTVAPVAQYAARNFKHVSVFYSNDDLGQMVVQNFTSIFISSGRVSQKIFYDPKANNARDIVSAFRPDECDAVFIAGSVSPMYVSLFKELIRSGFSKPIMTDITFSNEFVYKALGEHAEGVVFACVDSQFDIPETEAGRQFKELCEREGIVPYYVSMEAFDVLNVVSLLLKNNYELAPHTFTRSMDYKGVLNNFRFEEHGDCFYQYNLATIKSGCIVPEI